MANASKRSVLHILCMMLAFIIIVEVPMAATESSQLASPLLSHVENKKHGGEDHRILQALVKDYGIWDPAPTSGGGYAAPVPHGKQTRGSSSLPKSSSSPAGQAISGTRKSTEGQLA
ncbi:hypothetical protein SLA2020_413420 [Shorea laevis]